MKSNKSILKKIKGDASFRSFYRKTNNKKNSIIVYATKEKNKNLATLNKTITELNNKDGYSETDDHAQRARTYKLRRNLQSFKTAWN